MHITTSYKVKTRYFITCGDFTELIKKITNYRISQRNFLNYCNFSISTRMNMILFEKCLCNSISLYRDEVQVVHSTQHICTYIQTFIRNLSFYIPIFLNISLACVDCANAWTIINKSKDDREEEEEKKNKLIDCCIVASELLMLNFAV